MQDRPQGLQRRDLEKDIAHLDRGADLPLEIALHHRPAQGRQEPGLADHVVEQIDLRLGLLGVGFGDLGLGRLSVPHGGVHLLEIARPVGLGLGQLQAQLRRIQLTQGGLAGADRVAHFHVDRLEIAVERRGHDLPLRALQHERGLGPVVALREDQKQRGGDDQDRDDLGPGMARSHDQGQDVAQTGRELGADPAVVLVQGRQPCGAQLQGQPDRLDFIGRERPIRGRSRVSTPQTF